MGSGRVPNGSGTRGTDAPQHTRGIPRPGGSVERRGLLGIPHIVLVSSAEMNGAMGAYAISTGTIYLNADWLAGASQDQANAVLTEELRQHLDALLNSVDIWRSHIQIPFDHRATHGSKPTEMQYRVRENKEAQPLASARYVKRILQQTHADQTREKN